jgi:nicotinamidase-related amidase
MTPPPSVTWIHNWSRRLTKVWLYPLNMLVISFGNLGHLPASEPVRTAATSRQSDPIPVTLRNQVPLIEGSGRYMSATETQHWSVERVAIIICDVWDSHHCLNAVRRVHELTPRIDAIADYLRDRGATVIHAPSDCMAAYDRHPSRDRARRTRSDTEAPESIRSWCNAIESEANLPYPIDQSDGGEDDNIEEHAQWKAMLESMGHNPRQPWLRQSPGIGIDADKDYISDSGAEIWRILKEKNIEHVLLCGVHTNMCVLGRPFGLRQLRKHGFHAILLRDLTDTMYNPQRWPFVNHFSGTDLVIDHIERSVCQTISSDQISGGMAFRFAHDLRPRWVVMISEDEYRTEKTLAEWCRIHLARDCKVQVVFEHPNQPGHFPGIDALDEADGLLLSVRRRPLASETMQRVRAFVERGGSVLGIRTSSHAFSLRENAPSPGLDQWPEFDAQVFGGNYHGHHPDGPTSRIKWSGTGTFLNSLLPSTDSTPPDTPIFESRGSLYRVTPLQPATQVLWQGTISDQPSQPVAWTFVRADSGKSFYTSLGHESDFEQPPFRAMLLGASQWLTDTTSPVTAEEMDHQRRSYQSGQGKQK